MKNIIGLIIMVCCLTMMSCVQETYERKVQFSVDMKGIDAVEKVGLRGDFNPLSWKNDFELEQQDSSSIYTGEVVFDTPFDFVSVKFVQNGEIYELNGQDNRRVYFNKNGVTVYETVFNENEVNN